MNHRDSHVLPHRETFLELRYSVHLAPGNLVTIDISPTHRRDVRKPLGECSVYQAKYPAGGRSTDCRFHHPSGRRRADVNRSLGLEQRSQTMLQALEQLLELGSSMRNHRLKHRRHYFFPNLGRPRQEKSAKGFRSAHSSTSSLSWSKFSITKSARAITGSRRVKPVKAAKLSTTDFISQSVIPSPTASIGPSSPIFSTVVFLPVW